MKQRAVLISKAISAMAQIARLTVDGLSKDEVTIIVQALYDLAADIQQYYANE